MSRREPAERRPSFQTASDLPRAGRLRARATSADPGRDRRARPLPVHPRPAPDAATAAGSGRCGSTRASAPPRSRTAATATCSSAARPASPSPSTCRRRSATTPTTRTPRARSAASGVAIDSLEDMETLLDGIPLERVSTSMTINATAAILLALYIAVARRRGIAEDALSGTVQNDILKEYVARGTYIYPPAPVAAAGDRRLRLLRASGCRAGTPISISGYHIREAGATAPQEIAFTFAHALEYVRAARGGGPRSRRVRRAHLVLLRLPLRLHRGGREVPRRAAAVGAPRQGDRSASTTRARSTCASTCRRAG